MPRTHAEHRRYERRRLRGGALMSPAPLFAPAARRPPRAQACCPDATCFVWQVRAPAPAPASAAILSPCGARAVQGAII